MKLKTAVLASALLLGVAPAVGATTINYTVNINTTINDATSLSVAILEFDGLSSATFSSTLYTVYTTGVQTITHEAAFVPEKTIIVGIDPAVPGDATTQDHTVFFMNPDFYDLALGTRFRDSLGGLSYPLFRAHVDGALDGVQAEQAWLLDWAFGVSSGNEAGALGGTGLTAMGVGLAFDSYGPSIAGEYSILVPAAVPEPTSLLLLGTGLLAAGARRLRRRK